MIKSNKVLNTGKLKGKTLFITGASRGIGKAIALKAAADGANIVIAAKTAEPHPKLPGTIYTAAKEIEAAGGKALPCIVDVRDELQVRQAIQKAVETFGGIDIVINNASAISLTSTDKTEMKRFDLMHQVNVRGTFLVSKECLPYLKKSDHAHILNLSPPLYMKPNWFSSHVAYTMSKYGMSMCVLGMAEEFKSFDIAVNALWPKIIVSTAATDMLHGKISADYARKTDIMADAAYCTIYTAAKEIEAAGGKALPCIVDVRDELQVRQAIQKAVETFGGIDIVINNASAISLTSTDKTEMKRFDLMHQVNVRGTFLVSKECLPYLKKSDHAHILNLSPPLYMKPNWFSSHVAYTMSKYGMSMCVLGMAEEFKSFDIAVNALWPKIIVSTAATDMLHGKISADYARKTDIMADAAYYILTRGPECTGNFFIDENLLRQAGMTDFVQYACKPENAQSQKMSLFPDLFVEDDDQVYAKL